MNVQLNGEPRELADGTTVSDVVAAVVPLAGGRGVAVALDGQVLPRGEWEATRIEDGQRVEVLQAVQGG